MQNVTNPITLPPINSTQYIPLSLNSIQHFSISHMIGPTDLLHPSTASHIQLSCYFRSNFPTDHISTLYQAVLHGTAELVYFLNLIPFCQLKFCLVLERSFQHSDPLFHFTCTSCTISLHLYNLHHFPSPVHLAPLHFSCISCTISLQLYNLHHFTSPVHPAPFHFTSISCTISLHLYILHPFPSPVHLAPFHFTSSSFTISLHLYFLHHFNSPVHLAPFHFTCTSCTISLHLYILHHFTSPVHLTPFHFTCTSCTISLHLYIWHHFLSSYPNCCNV